MYCSNCGESISEKAEICPKCGVRPFREVNYCYSCGVEVNKNQEICVKCGVSLKKRNVGPSEAPKEPWLIALLSFLITGLGQIVVGQTSKGFVILLGSIVLAVITLGMSVFVTVPVAVIDGYLIAKKIQDGKQVGDWEFF